MNNPHNIFFQTIHSPRGASAGFAMGLAGKGGGFLLEDTKIPEQEIFVGVHQKGIVKCFPFFKEVASAAKESFVKGASFVNKVDVSAFDSAEIQRELGWGTDTWTAPGIKFEIAVPVKGVPEPGRNPLSMVKDAVAPAITARLTIDNSSGNEAVQGIFAIGGLKGNRLMEDETSGEIGGVATVDDYGFAYDKSLNPNVQTAVDFDLYHMFGRKERLDFRLAPMGGLVMEVEAGKQASIDIVFAWFKPGIATRGAKECVYAYTKYFANIADVMRYSLSSVDAWRKAAKEADAELKASGLNADRQFMIAQATRAYYTSSMLFDDGGKPRWVVNEGSFQMMNTFDLSMDHLFFELKYHPWGVRSQLDTFADEYSYYDTVHSPDHPEVSYNGGISFAHDQGVSNTYSPNGYSSYEVKNQDGCFSYMTQEQLCNWILCAAIYVNSTGDKDWLRRRMGIVSDCLDSMQNRDHHDKNKRDGIMDLDSDRCGLSSEITTYDSLDHSLGQARRNLYVAVKCWASYLGLARMFELSGSSLYQGRMDEAKKAARMCANTISSYFDANLGYIPAILNGIDKSAIIPAVEALVYPEAFGMGKAVSMDGEYADFISLLKRHLQAVLRPGVCIFPDNGWKLSANSINSWISKIFICQHVAEAILKVEAPVAMELSDRAHADWWRVGCPENPGIDQIFAGTQSEKGFYYPRAVSNILWLS